MAAGKEHLAVFYHRAPPMYLGKGACDQQISFRLFDLSVVLGWTEGRGIAAETAFERERPRKMIRTAEINLSPRSQLIWAAVVDGLFGESSGVSVVVVDTNGRVQASMEAHEHEMMVLSEAQQSLKASERIWPVAMTSSKLFGIITKPADVMEMTRMTSRRRAEFPSPPFAPRPILLSVDIEAPLLPSGDDLKVARSIASSTLQLLSTIGSDGHVASGKSILQRQVSYSVVRVGMMNYWMDACPLYLTLLLSLTCTLSLTADDRQRTSLSLQIITGKQFVG